MGSDGGGLRIIFARLEADGSTLLGEIYSPTRSPTRAEKVNYYLQ